MPCVQLFLVKYILRLIIFCGNGKRKRKPNTESNKIREMTETEPNESEMCERTLERVKVVSKLAQNEQVMTAVY